MELPRKKVRRRRRSVWQGTEWRRIH